MTILRAIQWLASKLPRRDIYGEDNTLYLSRYRVLGWMPGSSWRWPFSVYLHRFHRPDLDDALHNHPWRWALSLILTGGYTEENAGWGDRWNLRFHRRRPWSFRLLRASSYHRVHELHGEVWTLFVVGPKAQSWGFMVDGAHVPWKQRLADRGIQVTPGTEAE